MAKDSWQQLVKEATERLRSPDATVRSDAALSLGKLDAPEAPAPVVAEAIDALSRILDDPDEYVRKSAVHALGRLRARDPRALEGIRFALGDRSEQVVQEAVTQVQQAADAGAVDGLIRVLGRRERTLQNAASQALVRIGAPAVRPLLETFKDRNLRRRVHNQVLRIIEDIKGRAVEPLLGALEDENQYVRAYAVALLGRLGDERAVEPLVRLFLTDARLQETVVNTLPRLEERGVLEAPSGDRDVQLPKEVAAAFRKLASTPEALQALLAAVAGGNPKVRKFALRALFEVEGARARETLLGLLRDEDTEVQRLAIRLLGKLHDKTVIEPLLALLKGANPQVEEVVWNTIKVLTDLREYEQLRSRVARERAGAPARPTVRVFKTERDVSPDWWRDQD
ncbi:MAG: HEAT repeat domain-containing protein [Armatimonadota bacterium]|nr:HEAT repeat domain-containing protein [Armatimonadota bacterium]MDR7387617.1 HEAT repeat domain-containing protein [Armatimonadota bacterium]MDR7429588.1 HEAT repeat domain-containing protein [Armatimonadota bacterium]MDR7445883.1 HEAT repeat domain-containing protein [Armatimonadota bacterium]MDR7461835.1 HEAT repeat domain-containing protein [Armatimonadota bacterium]